MTRVSGIVVTTVMTLFAASSVFGAGAHAQAPDDEPITLSPEVADAPMLTAGIHRIAVGADPGLFGVERTIPGSTLWVGESVTTANLANGEIGLAAQNADGDDCGWSSDGVVADYLGDHEFRTGIVNSGTCTGDVVVYFAHTPSAEADFAGEPITVTIWEEPPVANPDVLTGASTEVSWNGEADGVVEGGPADLAANLADAPDLSEGTWQVRVTPGRGAIFAVPLDWNQHVQVGLRHQGLRVTDGYRPGDVVDIEPLLITPLGGEADWAQATASASGTQPPPSQELAAVGQPKVAGVVSPSIQWRNREEPGLNPAAFPGTYYVALRVNADANLSKAAAEGMEVQLSVDVITDGEPTSPYRNAAPAMPALNRATAPAPDDEPGAAAEDDGADPVVVGGLFAVALAMAGGGTALLGRWRRLTGRAA